MGILEVLRKRRQGRDAHGQPLEAAFRSEAVIDRQIDELLGVVKGIIADDVVTLDEANFLLRWLETNRQASKQWPANVIYPRIYSVLADDGYLDNEEEKEILELLRGVVGGSIVPDEDGSLSTSLPYTQPPPNIVFTDELFCFTGKFYCGSRKWCQNQVVERGGIISTGVTQKLDYLVIGAIGSRDWIHSTHGRKIEKVIKLNEKGSTIQIVGEEHWTGSFTREAKMFGKD